jgi:hypothetical protein
MREEENHTTAGTPGPLKVIKYSLPMYITVHRKRPTVVTVNHRTRISNEDR